VASKVGSARSGYPMANQYGDLIRSSASVNPVSTLGTARMHPAVEAGFG